MSPTYREHTNNYSIVSDCRNSIEKPLVKFGTGFEDNVAIIRLNQARRNSSINKTSNRILLDDPLLKLRTEFDFDWRRLPSRLRAFSKPWNDWRIRQSDTLASS